MYVISYNETLGVFQVNVMIKVIKPGYCYGCLATRKVKGQILYPLEMLQILSKGGYPSEILQTSAGPDCDLGFDEITQLGLPTCLCPLGEIESDIYSKTME